MTASLTPPIRMDSAPVPVNSLTRHIAPLRERLAAVADEVIASGHFVLGLGVETFEQAFADYCGVAHCIGVGNGTDALELAAKAIGVVPGDRVAVTANAAMYATSAVLACGAQPVFVDVREDATIDVDALSKALVADAGICAVVVTHLFGRLSDVAALATLCDAHGLAMIEDCAQAHGARDASGRRAGAFADVAAFSFYPTKNLGALGDGGAVVTRDAGIAARVRGLRQYGWERKYVNTLTGGRNSRLDELQARALSLMLPLLDAWNTRRRTIANRYSREITHLDITVPAVASDDYVAHLYVVRSHRRDALRAHLADAGVQTDIHYPLPDHRQPCHAGRYAGIHLPVTERHAATSLTLPCFPELSDAEAGIVIATCNRF
ncbi:MAG: DegT/DnrJ/EryC1/StrS family aminotransferase [Luteimonas sp.]